MYHLTGKGDTCDVYVICTVLGLDHCHEFDPYHLQSPLNSGDSLTSIYGSTLINDVASFIDGEMSEAYLIEWRLRALHGGLSRRKQLSQIISSVLHAWTVNWFCSHFLFKQLRHVTLQNAVFSDAVRVSSSAVTVSASTQCDLFILLEGFGNVQTLFFFFWALHPVGVYL
jgi:hypothetical protein